ncbi:hypothetical protein N7U49_42630 [Streptomyces sp. AD2-2]|nr:hypothetical protein N7U49_42630 [Streptomyces sp. AD2-2]
MLNGSSLTTSAAGTPAAPGTAPAPLIRAANPVPGKCIVTFGKLVAPVKTAQTLGLKRRFRYRKALNGFAVPLTPSQPTLVRSVSTPVTAPAASVPRGQTSAWGLDRIDHKELPLDCGFTSALRHSEFGRHTTFGSDAPGNG